MFEYCKNNKIKLKIILKKSTNYHDIQKEILSLNDSKNLDLIIETIHLDINRTPFETDIDQKRNV